MPKAEIKKTSNEKKLTKELSTALKAEIKNKKIQILRLVQQCINSQETFGKTEEQLEDLKKIMCELLPEYEIEDINQAFLDWIRQSSKIPTFFDIKQIIEKSVRKRNIKRLGRVKRLEDFNFNMKKYNKYLIENGLK